MDKICERFVTFNNNLRAPMVPVSNVFSFCVRNTIDKQVYYVPSAVYSERIDEIILRLVDTAISWAEHEDIASEKDWMAGYKKCLDYMTPLAVTHEEKVGLGCLYCIVYAASRGHLLFVPPNLLSLAVKKHYDSSHIAAQLYSVTFSIRRLIEFDHYMTAQGVDPIYGFKLNKEGLWKGIGNSLFLQGKGLDYGFGLSRLGGAARISVKTQTITIETPHYKMRHTLSDDKYDKYWDTELIFLWWLSTVPTVFPIRGFCDEYMRALVNKLNSSTGESVKRVINETDWYRTGVAVYMDDGKRMYLVDRDVPGPDYGGSRDFTKIRYLEGVGNLDRLIKEACSKTAMNVSGIANLYYAV